METQYERAMEIKDRQISEQCAMIQGLRLALKEAERQIVSLTEQIDELTQPHADKGKKNRG